MARRCAGKGSRVTPNRAFTTCVLGSPVTPAGSVFRDEFDLAILQLQENNRLEILKRKWWEGGKCPKEEDHRAKGKDVQGHPPPALEDQSSLFLMFKFQVHIMTSRTHREPPWKEPRYKLGWQGVRSVPGSCVSRAPSVHLASKS